MWLRYAFLQPGLRNLLPHQPARRIGETLDPMQRPRREEPGARAGRPSPRTSQGAASERGQVVAISGDFLGGRVTTRYVQSSCFTLSRCRVYKKVEILSVLGVHVAGGRDAFVSGVEARL
jgi:hypothetical protein